MQVQTMLWGCLFRELCFRTCAAAGGKHAFLCSSVVVRHLPAYDNRTVIPSYSLLITMTILWGWCGGGDHQLANFCSGAGLV